MCACQGVIKKIVELLTQRSDYRPTIDVVDVVLVEQQLCY